MLACLRAMRSEPSPQNTFCPLRRAQAVRIMSFKTDDTKQRRSKKTRTPSMGYLLTSPAPAICVRHREVRKLFSIKVKKKY